MPSKVLVTIMKRKMRMSSMLNKMMFGVVGITITGFLAGIAHSSFKHYSEKYSEDEDLVDSSVQRVVIMKDETKKTRRSK